MDELAHIKSWEEFVSIADSKPPKERGDFFERFTKHYFTLDSKYKSEFSNVWLWSEVPSQVKDDLNLPSRDMGIDIVAKTRSGKYWAVQCKYRGKRERPLSWREVSTSVALSFVGKKFEGLIIAHTSDKWATILNRAEGKIVPLSLEEWEALDATFYSRLNLQVQQGFVPLPDKRQPRNYQEIAIKKAIEHFLDKNNSRGKLIMPCGAGKSLTAFWIAESLKAKTILVALPSLSLIQQTLPDWLNEYAAHGESERLRYRCVCSDKTVESEIDSLVVHVHDLGFPCSTSSEEVQEWLRDTRDADTRVIFTTYHSGKIVSEAIRAEGIEIDLGIMDEAHKTVGKKGQTFTHLLFDENIPIKKRLFMTATERRFQGSTETIVSMDDASIYGEMFEYLSFKSAIDQGILSDYKIITMIVSSKEIEKYIQEKAYLYENDDLSLEGEATMLASAVALTKVMKKYGINHPVSFHSSVAKAEKFRKIFSEVSTEITPDLGSVATFHVSGKTPAVERKKKIKDFAAAEQALITNARCLTEGVDVKKIDCVLFADPRKSKVDIVQAAGRAMRKLDGKDFGYILVPVISRGEPPHEFVDTEAFQAVLDVIKALAANDERIIDELKEKKEGRTGRTRVIDVVGTDFVAENFDLNEFASHIETKVWNRIAPLSVRYLPYEDAVVFARSLNLKNFRDWWAYIRGEHPELPIKPDNVPSAPHGFYSDFQERGGWAAWIGKRSTSNFRSYEDAIKFVHPLKLKGAKEWRQYVNGGFPNLPPLPNDIPKAPHASHTVYSDFFARGGFPAWVGSSKKSVGGRRKESGKKGAYLPHNEAQAFVRSLNLTRFADYLKAHKAGRIPKNIPRNPAFIYGEEYRKGGSGAWLGTTRRVRGHMGKG